MYNKRHADISGKCRKSKNHKITAGVHRQREGIPAYIYVHTFEYLLSETCDFNVVGKSRLRELFYTSFFQTTLSNGYRTNTD